MKKDFAIQNLKLSIFATILKNKKINYFVILIKSIDIIKEFVNKNFYFQL